MKTPLNRRKFSFSATAAAALAAVSGRPAAAAGNVSPERKAALINAIKTVQAYQEVSNLMSRFMFAMNNRQADRVLDCFALKQQDVSWEYDDEGVFQGPEVVKQIINEAVGAPVKAGEMVEQHLTAPGIELAGDLKTAKGYWRAPGFGTIAQVEVLPIPIWKWDFITADFIDEGNNSWKIWHGHSYRFIKSEYHKGWVDDISMVNRLNVPVHPLSKPSTFHSPFTPLCIREAVPACPIPYQTYTDSSWMLEKDKSK